MVYENILFDTKDTIATITFNRPKALNALNSMLLEEFSRALDDIVKDENIRVLILTGSGDKAFVAGADIKELSSLTPLDARAFSLAGQEIINRLQQLPIPVIAAVNGYALGGGTELALACDFIYAAETASFGLPEITLGIIPGFGGSQRLPRAIGMNQAKEMIFTGKIIAAEEALTLGLVNSLYPADLLMEKTLKTAHTISKMGKVSLRSAKHAINQGANTDLITGLGIESDSFTLCMNSKDAKEGMTAFIEKRKAEFKGSWSD